MSLNAVLGYLGTVGIVVGGLGVAYHVAVPPNDASEPAEITATAPETPPASMPVAQPNTTAQTSGWPMDPRHGAVPFYEPMLQLLTPPAPEEPAQTAAVPAETDTTVGVATRDSEPRPRATVREPPRETARDRAKDRKKNRTASPPESEPDATVGVATRGEPTAREAAPSATSRETARERAKDRKERKAKSKKQAEEDDGEDAVEVVVRDPSGRTMRIERVPREKVERTARDDREPRVQRERFFDRGRGEEPRQYERREYDGERRGFGFPLFGIFRSDRW